MCVVWGSASAQLIKHLDCVIKAAARLVYRKKRRDSISDLIKSELKWLMTDDLVKLLTLSCIHKLMFSEFKPEYFDNFFPSNSDIHSYNTRSSRNIHLNSVIKTSSKRSFKVRATNLWNSCKYKDIATYSLFKKNVMNDIVKALDEAV